MKTRNRIVQGSIFSLTLGVSASCMTDELPGDEVITPRSGDLVAANGDVDIYSGDPEQSNPPPPDDQAPSDPPPQPDPPPPPPDGGDLTYTIGGDGPTASGITEFDPDGSLTTTVSQNGHVIYDSGVPVCVVVQDTAKADVYRLKSGNETIHTLYDRYVFHGDVNVPTLTSAFSQLLAGSTLAFSYWDEHVYDGPTDAAPVLATLSVDDLALATPVRKLLVAALISGECGSGGVR